MVEIPIVTQKRCKFMTAGFDSDKKKPVVR